jgi:type III secretion protein J
MLNYLKKFLIISLFCILAGCKVDLYSELSEEQANEMIALLLQNDIYTEKMIQKGELVTLRVDENQFASAVNLLKVNGYPKNSYVTSEVLFQDSGMVSSPTEEWAKFTYARSQEVAQTLSQIDGVVLARVHIAVPKKITVIDKAQPPSASVLIKYDPAYDLVSLTPHIKKLVMNSIEGLEYDQVSLVMTPTVVQNSNSNSFMNLNGNTVGIQKSSDMYLYGLLFLGLVVVGGGAWFILGRGQGIIRA